MTSVRRQLADHVQAHNTGLDVVPYGADPKELKRPLVAVFRESLDQGSNTLESGFIVQIFSPYSYTSEEAEDALDDALDGVLLALRRLDVVAWTKAERKVFADLFQGWEIAVTWTSGDYYKNTVTPN